jgi:hypothetical protein
METPAGYVRLDPVLGYDYRAVSADGAVISVRTVDNPRDATLEFWNKAISNELVEARGYKLNAKQDVKSERGTAGTEMTLRTQVEGIDYVYLLTVFVKSRQVIVFEAAGPASTIEPDLPAIRNAVRASPRL